MHRPFVIVATLFVLVGSGLGLLMLPLLAGWGGDAMSWAPRLQAHGQFQLLGFCVVFTMGIAYQMLGELLGARPPTSVLYAVLGLMTLGTLGQAWQPGPLWQGCQFLSALIFVAGVARHRPRPGQPRRGRAHSHFLRWGSLWLLAALLSQRALGYELVLWGFLSLYILGVGLRVHPSMLGRPSPAMRSQWVVLLLWNAGLVFTWAEAAEPAALCWLIACLVFLVSMRPWATAAATPQDFPLTGYLSAAYGWLLIACLGRFALAFELCPLQWAGAVKHAHASGFVLTMMMGMGWRLIPGFEGAPAALPAVRRLGLGLIVTGTALRVVGQAGLAPWALVPGGALQGAAVTLFCLSILLTMGTKRTAWTVAGG